MGIVLIPLVSVFLLLHFYYQPQQHGRCLLEGGGRDGKDGEEDETRSVQ